MGTKLLQYYDLAKKKGGMVAQVKLAMKTAISQPKAAAAPDSPELSRLFYQALVEIVGDDPSIPKP